MNLDVNGDGVIQPLELSWVQLWDEGRLTGISCNSCGLIGNIPLSISNAEYLVTLIIGNNQFNGMIPEAISSLSNLGVIVLTSNNLTGPLPESLDNLTSLIYLHISNNLLTGNIDENICNLEIDWGGNDPWGDPYFRITNNYFCQEIPSCIIPYMQIQICDWYSPGDINEDGEINILDILMIVSFILADDIPTQFQEINSDMDEDNIIDILDIILVVNLILNN